MEARGHDPDAGTRRAPPPPSPDWALFFDIDGCLIDFAPHPEEIVVPEGLQQAIARLATMLGGALALVSGRSLDSIDGVFGELRHLPAAGMHGLERREPDGRRTPAPPAPPALVTIENEALEIADDFPGAMVERKGPNLAMHWRAAPIAAEAFRDFAARALQRLPDYLAQPGDHVLELRPGGDTPDKGGAVETFLAQAPFRGRMPVFIGDDLTDEHAFAVVNARGGLSVLVGARTHSAARWHLDDPTAVRAWIARAVARDGVHA